jgi:hypothetical protein
MYKLQNKGYLNLFDLKIKYHILLNLIQNESNQQFHQSYIFLFYGNSEI